LKKIILTSNTTWSIYNFRLSLIKKLQQKGFEIHIISPKDKFAKKLLKEGCNFHNIAIDNKGINPFNDLKTLYNYYKLYKYIKPNMIFHYTIKPNLYGTLSAKLLNINSIAVVTGLGYVFIKKNLISKIVKLIYKFSFLFANEVWFLNKDDRDEFVINNIISKNKTFILNGEGIDTNKFKPVTNTKKDNKFKFLLIARMLWDKGVGEYIEASNIIAKNTKYNNVEFQLLGFLGVDNPSAISKKQMNKWEKLSHIKYLGVSDNVYDFIQKSDSIVLPSYREGISRTLLEGASMAKPLIATNSVGCKEIIDDGINGYLCKIKSSKSLAKKMELMINLSTLDRLKMGKKGRAKIIKQFDESLIINEYLKVIQKLCL
jgi:glycosyltransferase involved in cell wall biosynthesis